MNKNRWTSDEKKNLQEHYPAISAKRMTELLSGRTEKAIYSAAQQLGVKKCHERLAEQGRENIQKRKDRQCSPFAQPPSISS